MEVQNNSSSGDRQPRILMVNLQGQEYFHARRIPINEGQMVAVLDKEDDGRLVVACGELNYLLVKSSFVDEINHGKERRK